MIFIFILYALVAVCFTLAKASLSYAQPIFFVGIRSLIAGTLLLGYYALKTRAMPLIKREDVRDFLYIVLFHIYGTFTLDLVALQYMTSYKGAYIFNLSPFIAALFSYCYFSERMTKKKWLGLIIGFIGFMPELIIQAPGENKFSSFLNLTWGEFLMLGSVVCSVIGWTVVRKLVKKSYSPIMVNGTGMIGGGLLALVTSYCVESWNPVPVHDTYQLIRIMLLLILFANIIFYNLYGYLLKRYTATFLSFAGFITPLIAAGFGWLFLGESLSWHFFFSLCVVTFGLWLFYEQELHQGYITR